ncbi:hypothetical protein SBADM41S_06400 [Streptomyces badius]
MAEAHPELLDLPGAVADTVRLQVLAADLLLARLDAGEKPGGGTVELGALVREEVSQRTGDRIAVAVETRRGTAGGPGRPVVPDDARTGTRAPAAQVFRDRGQRLQFAQRLGGQQVDEVLPHR